MVPFESQPRRGKRGVNFRAFHSKSFPAGSI
jgi:hypothetical protein